METRASYPQTNQLCSINQRRKRNRRRREGESNKTCAQGHAKLLALEGNLIESEQKIDISDSKSSKLNSDGCKSIFDILPIEIITIILHMVDLGGQFRCLLTCKLFKHALEGKLLPLVRDFSLFNKNNNKSKFLSGTRFCIKNRNVVVFERKRHTATFSFFARKLDTTPSDFYVEKPRFYHNKRLIGYDNIFRFNGPASYRREAHCGQTSVPFGTGKKSTIKINGVEVKCTDTGTSIINPCSPHFEYICMYTLNSSQLSTDRGDYRAELFIVNEINGCDRRDKLEFPEEFLKHYEHSSPGSVFRNRFDYIIEIFQILKMLKTILAYM